MIYLDANVFIHSSLNLRAIGEKSRTIIKEVQLGKISATTSALSFDELVWAVKKQRGETAALIAGQVILNTAGLSLIEVDRDILNSALALISKYHLNPRDSIHAASAMQEGAEYIVSEDPDFDALKEIKRKSILQV